MFTLLFSMGDDSLQSVFLYNCIQTCFICIFCNRKNYLFVRKTINSSNFSRRLIVKQHKPLFHITPLLHQKEIYFSVSNVVIGNSFSVLINQLCNLSSFLPKLSTSEACNPFFQILFCKLLKKHFLLYQKCTNIQKQMAELFREDGLKNRKSTALAY